MPVILSPSPKQQFFTNGSEVAAGYSLHTYAAGTTTQEATFSNWRGTAQNTNPIVLNARGEAQIYLSPGVVYDFVLKDGDGAEIWTQEDVVAGPVGVVSVEQFGAQMDGITDDTAAIQAAADYVGDRGGGEITFPKGTAKIGSTIFLDSNTCVTGAGIGATTIKHGAAHAFKNRNYATTGNSNITVKGFTFDAQGTWDGGVVVVGVNNLIVRDCRFTNIRTTDVTVGIGVSSLSGVISRVIEVSGCIFECPDYGIVLDPGTGNEIRNVRIIDNHFTMNWGSAISLAKLVKRVTITGNTIDLLGDILDLQGNAGSGIGVKIWEGPSLGNGPEDVTITGNIFRGAATLGTGMQAISVANFSNNIVVTGNTFRQVYYAFYNNFSGVGANNVTFSNNVVKGCVWGFFNDTSSDVEPTIIGNTFRDCTGGGIKSALNHGVVNGNKFADITGKAIHCMSPTEGSTIVGNVMKNISQEAIYFATDSGANEVCNISSNVIEDCCLAADNTYSVIQLNTQSHIVSNNIIRNSSSSVKPIWIIAGAGNWRTINGNWMFGARSGYRQTAGANDAYTGNTERGGIG